MAVSEVALIVETINDHVDQPTYLPGQAWADEDNVGPPLGPELTPEAYETVTQGKALIACAVVSESAADDGAAAAGEDGRAIYVRVGLYHRTDYRQIRQAGAWIRGLLDPQRNGQQMGPLDDGRYFIVRYMYDQIKRGTDDGIESAEVVTDMGVCYEAQLYRLEATWPTL